MWVDVMCVFVCNACMDVICVCVFGCYYMCRCVSRMDEKAMYGMFGCIGVNVFVDVIRV